MIETDDDLKRVAASLRGVRALGFDSEGDGYYRYRARVCAVQMAHPGGVVLVDSLAVSLAPLAELLGENGPEKIIHDCAFDARMLAAAGLRLRRVFDTSVAARFLGEVSTGLSSLLSRYVGVELDKSLQQHDWGARPIGERERRYLEEDVLHLLPLADLLRERCRDAGILEEVLVESEWAADPEDPDDPGPAWLRVKGALELRRGPERAVLRELAALREEIAEREDVSPFRVLPNPVLVMLARKAGREGVDVRGLSALARRRDLREAILDAVKRGLEQADAPAEELALAYPPAPPPGERESRKAREQALSTWRAAAAKERGVDVQVVLPGHCLRYLAARGARSDEDLRAVRGFGECRVERYGSAIVDALTSASAGVTED